MYSNKNKSIHQIIVNMKSTLTRSKVKTVNQLIKPYPGRWVALSQDDTYVVSVASSPKAVLSQARKKGETSPHLVKSPDGSTSAIVF